MVDLLSAGIPDEVPRTGTTQLLMRMQVGLVGKGMAGYFSCTPCASANASIAIAVPVLEDDLPSEFLSVSGTVYLLMHLLNAISLTAAKGFLGRCLPPARPLAPLLTSPSLHIYLRFPPPSPCPPCPSPSPPPSPGHCLPPHAAPQRHLPDSGAWLPGSLPRRHLGPQSAQGQGEARRATAMHNTTKGSKGSLCAFCIRPQVVSALS